MPRKRKTKRRKSMLIRLATILSQHYAKDCFIELKLEARAEGLDCGGAQGADAC